MNRTVLFIAAAVFFQAACQIRASGRESGRELTERNVVSHLASIYNGFMHTHQRPPVDWKEIEASGYLGGANESLRRARGYTLPERYVILSRPVPIVNQAGRKLIVLRVAPIRSGLGSEPQWHAVYTMPDGRYTSDRFSIGEIQRSLQAANYELVRPPGIPEVELSAEAKAMRVLLIVLAAVGVVGLAGWIWGRRRMDKEEPPGNGQNPSFPE